MKQKTQLLAVLLLSSFYSIAQAKYDTMTVMHLYDGETKYSLVQKEIRNYDTKGRLTDVFTYEYTAANPKAYLFYKEKYVYGTNDSLKTLTISEVPVGEDKFFVKAVHDYYYTGKQLTEMKTTTYALTGKEAVENRDKALHWRMWYGGSITDSTGWTTVSTTKYYYDEQGRLIKKALYRDQKDKGPETMWLYNYGKSLPDLNDYFQHGFLMTTVHNYLYKRDLLVTYRRETREVHIDVRTEDYNYNRDDKISKVLISEKTMVAKNNGDPYKQSGKERLTDRREYSYKNGLLVSMKKEYRTSYIKYKVSFGDRLAAIGSVRGSTVRYGDYQSTTITSTTPPPPDKMVAKTKYEWQGYDISYEYDASGRMIEEGARTFSYDEKGRLKEYSYPVYKDSYTVKLIYGYRNK